MLEECKGNGRVSYFTIFKITKAHILKSLMPISLLGTSMVLSVNKIFSVNSRKKVKKYYRE
ncbi:Uncharacterised protein [Yersinia pseudotuberculosis]|uniref:Uncharacterized protein n=1 Tax=Yersinia pseudotuberculosis TaxID=633 RepID=A0A380Q4T9_YERPU|nr:Uncharacterised protein [Yersinia pseudotuberculosis]SUP80806.1 Uncharacterised protein [Yersinia pseudotuberculosis]